MNADYFRTIYDFGYWARDHLLAAMAGMSDEDFARSNGFTYGSISGILDHTLRAETSWLRRWRRQKAASPGSEAETAGIEALTERWRQQESEMRAFLAGLSDADLEVEFVTESRGGGEFRLPFWAYLAQVANHGTQHRSEAAEALTLVGRSPGDLDLIYYVRQRADLKESN